MEQQQRRPWKALVALLLLAAAGVAAASYFRAMPVETPPAALASDSSLRVESDGLGLSFIPAAAMKDLGLIFYPGARVPPEAYAYLGRALAARGWPVVIVRFPLNFAIFAAGKADRVIEAARLSLPGVRRWAIGGHSLGGAMAASWAAKSAPAGLALLASYPGGGADLSGLTVLSLGASGDGLATPAKLAAARSLLPADARAVEIAGGNHAQFGEYGPQPGDGPASLGGEAQRAAVVAELLAFMESVAAPRAP